MKKFAIIIFIFLLLFIFPFSNVFGFEPIITKLEIKRDSGKSTSVVYNQDWETVYDAVKYVLRHSAGGVRYGQYWIDLAKEEKAIYYLSSYDNGVGIFFNSLSDNRTKVDYVKTGFYTPPSAIVKALVEEMPYLLEHGQQAYREHLHKLKQKKEREFQEESIRNRNF